MMIKWIALMAMMVLMQKVSGQASMNTPWNIAAVKSLQSGDPSSVLYWINNEDESVLREAFMLAMKVRGKGVDEQRLSDAYFTSVTDILYKKRIMLQGHDEQRSIDRHALRLMHALNSDVSSSADSINVNSAMFKALKKMNSVPSRAYADSFSVLLSQLVMRIDIESEVSGTSRVEKPAEHTRSPFWDQPIAFSILAVLIILIFTLRAVIVYHHKRRNPVI